MSVGTMTSKGQITVPKDVRDELGLTAGTKVTFAKRSSGEYVITVTRPVLADLAGRLRHSGKPKSLEDMDSAIASAANESA